MSSGRSISTDQIWCWYRVPKAASSRCRWFQDRPETRSRIVTSISIATTTGARGTIARRSSAPERTATCSSSEVETARATFSWFGATGTWPWTRAGATSVPRESNAHSRARFSIPIAASIGRVKRFSGRWSATAARVRKETSTYSRTERSPCGCSTPTANWSLRTRFAPMNTVRPQVASIFPRGACSALGVCARLSAAARRCASKSTSGRPSRPSSSPPTRPCD